jgi:hypothetical protein
VPIYRGLCHRRALGFPIRKQGFFAREAAPFRHTHWRAGFSSGRTCM